MSPTLGQGHYGTLGNMPSPPPGRDGHPGSQDATQTPAQVHAAGGVGFASDTAAGRASGGGDPAEGTPQVSTTTDGGIASAPRSAPPRSIAPGGSPGPEANASAHQAASSEARPAMDLSGGGVLGGIRSTGETVGAEGFVTPRSQHGLPTIAEMVEGFPATGFRIMSRVGEFFQVARTEVLPVVPSVEQQATPPRSVMRTRAGPLALGDGIVASQTGSPPQVGSRSTPTSFAPGPGRETPLLNAEMLQRMQALEHRAPLLYPRQPVVSDRPQSGTDSTSIPQEAIQAEVARQLAVLDQRATARELEMSAQELEIQRLRQQIAEANAQRDQALRVAALSSAQSTARVPVPTFEQPPQVAAHFEPGQYRKVTAKFIDEARRVAVDFGVAQPLTPAELRTDTAHGIRQLSRHMRLSEPDSDWLLCLASHLEAELGEVLVPALWQLKDDVVTSTMRRERPREPLPFSLPPAVTDMTDVENSPLPAPERKKRPRSSSP